MLRSIGLATLFLSSIFASANSSVTVDCEAPVDV